MSEKVTDLSNLTAAEFLLFSSPSYQASLRAELEPDASARGRLTLVPQTQGLPQAVLSAERMADDTRTGTLSVGSDNLRYSRVATERPQNQGTVVRDTLEGGIGPFSGFFVKETDPMDKGRITNRFGGSANIGPVTLYGEKEKTAQTVVPEERRRFYANPNVNFDKRVFGVRGSVPMGQGTLSADLFRQLSGAKVPQSIFDRQRPEQRNPNVTELRGGYEGKVGPGILGLTGRFTDIRGMGTDKEFGVSYNIDDPFGLGGRLTAQGTYANPYGGRSVVQAGRFNEANEMEGGLRYTIPLGGRR